MIDPKHFGFEKLERADLMERSGGERMLIGSLMFEWWREKMIATFPPNLSEREFKRMLYERTYDEPAPADFPTNAV